MSGKNLIAIFKNGPLHITGMLELRNDKGKLIEKNNELYLCRCGHSNNKPYCDGQHKEIMFQESGEFKKPPPSIPDMTNGGVLEIKVQDDGQLLFKGNVTLVDAAEDTINRKVGGLCRCGNSANQPFCDGSHMK